jgi:nicotinamidase-related amidase
MGHGNASRQSGENRLSSDNTTALFVDHQTGLMQLVRDYPFDEFKNNVLALADIALLFKLPTILTTSFEKGPNGPLLPELKKKFSHAPYIARPGQINAWDNEDFVQEVKKTHRKKLLIAGIVTDVCVAFPALSALNEGYDVYIVVDASGTFNRSVRDATLMRLVHAGAILTNWFSVASELQRDWRHDAQGLTKLLTDHLVPYENLVNSYQGK